jgi:hypothetical protein
MNQLAQRNALTKSDKQQDYILVDCSSSMADKWFESIGSIDAYIAALRAANVNSDVILHMFYTTNPDYIHSHTSIDQWVPMIESAPGPQGTTPLYDAVNLMGRRLRALDPPRASIVIVTDGDDSSSTTTADQARMILDWIRAKGWQITFIGCDFSTSRMAKLLGASASAAIGVQKKLLTDAAKSLAKKRQNYGLYGTPMNWSEDEQKQFGGYLAAPDAK